MNKNVQFLGVFAKDEEKAKVLLINLTKYAITRLLEQFNDQELKLMLTNLEKDYKFPNSIHMTTLFVGKNKHLLQQTDFKVGLEQNLVIDGLALSPKNIVTAILNKNYDVTIQNQYSHLTTLVGSWQPKDSNTLLQSVFSQLPYEAMKEQVNQDQCWKLPMQQGSVYVIQFKEKVIIPGECKMH